MKIFLDLVQNDLSSRKVRIIFKDTTEGSSLKPQHCIQKETRYNTFLGVSKFQEFKIGIMAGFGKSTNGVSTFSVREILNLKEDSQKNIEAVSETERSVYEVDQHNEEKLEFRKVESEMEGKIDGDSGRFTKDNLD